MGTKIRPEISKRNKYWLNKHRHYELKHFCLQYPIWKKIIFDIYNSSSSSSIVENTSKSNGHSDPTGNIVVTKLYYSDKISLIESIAKNTDEYLYEYILKAVTEGRSYNNLKTKFNIPCSRDVYYDRYRKFFWLLSQEKH